MDHRLMYTHNSDKNNIFLMEIKTKILSDQMTDHSYKNFCENLKFIVNSPYKV